MENNITETKLNRRYAFWFLIVSSFLITLTALLTEEIINDSIVSSYLIFTGSIVSVILGVKTVDNSFKVKIAEAKINKGE